MEWVLVVIALSTIAYFFKKRKKAAQLAYIDNYHFHPSIKNKISERHPSLTDEQINLVFQGLRDYFHICNHASRRPVSMPSKIVDEAWHEFILFTRAYKHFCRKALGRFLHHTPAEAMASSTTAQEGIKRAWRLACAKESISTRSPSKLPLIFALDSMLSIAGGFEYSLDCKSSPLCRDSYCAGHIGCASGCAGDSGASGNSGGFFGDSADSSGGGSGCSGGCGGD